MNKNSRRLSVHVALVSIFTLLAVGFRSAACIMNLDFRYGYFDEKGLINTASIFLFFAMLMAFSFALTGKKISLRPSFSSPTTFVPTGIVGAALAFFALRLLGQIPDIRTSGNTVLLITTLLCGVCALLSIAHFFLNAFIADAKTELRSYFAIATVVAFSSYAAYLYFIGGTSINSPNRLTDQMAYLLCARFVLYEARISLGREKWRGYCVFGLAAAAATAYSALPTLVVYFVKHELLSISIEEIILSLSLFIFIAARTILVISLPDTEKNGKIAALESFANERKHAATDIERRYDEAYAVQLSIEDMIPDEEMPHVAEEYEPSDEFVFPDAEELSTVFIADEDPDLDDGQLEFIPEIFPITPPSGTGDTEDGTED